MKLDDFKNLIFTPLINFIKPLWTNPVTVFFWGIMGKWYVIMMCAALITLYWTYKALDRLGVLNKASTAIIQTLTDSKNMAKYCFPLLDKPKEFWRCANNLEHYRQYEEETDEMVRSLNKIEKEFKNMKIPTPFMKNKDNPYDK